MRIKLVTAVAIGISIVVIATNMASGSGASRAGAWGRSLSSGSRIAPETTRSHRGHRTITVLLTNTTDQFIDIDGQGPSQGDYDVFTDDLFRDGHNVGQDHGQCTLYDEGSALCWGNFTIGHGDISIQGTFGFSGTEASVAAVTGGTGRFTGADGTAELSITNNGRQKFTFHLTHSQRHSH
jgi:Allene oxide cyclase barrel like domain